METGLDIHACVLKKKLHFLFFGYTFQLIYQKKSQLEIQNWYSLKIGWVLCFLIALHNEKDIFDVQTTNFKKFNLKTVI